jgi:hypothetical protein
MNLLVETNSFATADVEIGWLLSKMRSGRARGGIGHGLVVARRVSDDINLENWVREQRWKRINHKIQQ